MTNILLLGGPGSGKGTLGKFLASVGGIHLSTGELFRYHMTNETEIGREVSEVIKAGGLAKDETTVKMMDDNINLELSKCIFPKMIPIVFDGFPRNLAQGPMLDELLTKYNRELDVVFYLNVPDEILMERLKGRAQVENRPEDADTEYCKKRISVFHQQTTPLINYYKNKQILVEIDGTKTIDEIRDFASYILISNR